MLLTACQNAEKLPKCVDIDGNKYEVVKIGGQYWIAEDLRVTHFRNGDPIAEVTSGEEWIALTTPAWCNYQNETYRAEIYGRLYNWYAVNDSRNLAPEGWHVATDEDWKLLEMRAGLTQEEADDIAYRGTAGGKLKEKGTEHWRDPNTGATNKFDFSARGSGYRGQNGVFYNEKRSYQVWTATDYNGESAWGRHLPYDHDYSYRDYYKYIYGFSVRLVKD
ncbi:fibrobacter succinogenes major paralogous domain-containing protein [bacterium]|nr:fibrobacter succinogenes major paralogous domain-containing protein [bacterium]